MREVFFQLRSLFEGKWAGEGFAKFPTIDDTAYTEQLEFIPDKYKDAIFYSQRAWYKNATPKNGHTVFWDTGFIILKDDVITLHSVQIGKRMEVYALNRATDQAFTFDSSSILNDSITIRSQRVFTLGPSHLHYELNMAIHGAEFQNHLQADLVRGLF